MEFPILSSKRAIPTKTRNALQARRPPREYSCERLRPKRSTARVWGRRWRFSKPARVNENQAAPSSRQALHNMLNELFTVTPASEEHGRFLSMRCLSLLCRLDELSITPTSSIDGVSTSPRLSVGVSAVSLPALLQSSEIAPGNGAGATNTVLIADLCSPTEQIVSPSKSLQPAPHV